jgi:uncharacterized membrane protein YecN with MAPEG domain
MADNIASSRRHRRPLHITADIVLPVTLCTASVLGVLFVLLSMAVSGERSRSKIGLGTGTEGSVKLGDEHNASRLFVAVRRHGSFAEYVPISLILLMLLELRGANRQMLIGLAAALLLARIMIVFGLGRAAPNLLRAGGNAIQYFMILVASAYGLVLVAT